MASAWGDSWGSAWGDSWGGGAAPVVADAVVGGHSYPPDWKPRAIPDPIDWKGKSDAQRRLLLEQAVRRLSGEPETIEEVREIVRPFIAPVSRETGAPVKLAKRQIPALAADYGRVTELLALYEHVLNEEEELFFLHML